MCPSHSSLFVEQEQSRPCFDFVQFPSRVIVIRDDWIRNAECSNFAAHVFDVSFAVSLWRVHADYGEGLATIASVPRLDRRQSITAVVTAEGPKLDQQHP